MYVDIPIKEGDYIKVSFKEETGTVMFRWFKNNKAIPVRFVFPVAILKKIIKGLILLDKEIEESK